MQGKKVRKNRKPGSAERIAVDLAEQLIVEDIRNTIEFIVIIDGDKKDLPVLVFFGAEDHIFFRLFVVGGSESIVSLAVGLTGPEQNELILLPVFIGQRIGFHFFFGFGIGGQVFLLSHNTQRKSALLQKSCDEKDAVRHN